MKIESRNLQLPVFCSETESFIVHPFLRVEGKPVKLCGIIESLSDLFYQMVIQYKASNPLKNDICWSVISCHLRGLLQIELKTFEVKTILSQYFVQQNKMKHPTFCACCSLVIHRSFLRRLRRLFLSLLRVLLTLFCIYVLLCIIGFRVSKWIIFVLVPLLEAIWYLA
jgi:hypothetical protein